MLQQIQAIIWAQFRISRNHLPRTSWGSIFMSILTSLWYLMFVALAVLAAIGIPEVPLATLKEALPIALLGIFLYAQTIPLFTLSSGWSLQINKLQCFPIRTSALFGLEVLLRITGTPEFLVLILGGVVGLLRRPDIHTAGALSLFLFVPLNLLLQLAAREFILHSFARNRFREIISIFFISIGVLPQFLIRTEIGLKLKPYFLVFANGKGTPWQATAALALGHGVLMGWAVTAFWTLIAFNLARWQFMAGLSQDDAFRAGARTVVSTKAARSSILDSIANLFQDPVAALVQKEFRSLLRMPRFRVVLGLACVLSTVIFVPMTMRAGEANFMSRNFFPFVSLYALLLLSDMLLLNMFGTDRSAAQIYFVTPIPLADVIKAKNIVAWIFVFFVNILVGLITYTVTRAAPVTLAAGFFSTAVATINLTWAGNLISVMTPRPSDPANSMQRRGSARNQLWILLCTMGMAILVGFAYLAQWAFDSNWGLFGVLAFEFIIGYVVYRISLDSATERALAERERMISALSKTSSPIGGSLG